MRDNIMINLMINLMSKTNNEEILSLDSTGSQLKHLPSQFETLIAGTQNGLSNDLRGAVLRAWALSL